MVDTTRPSAPRRALQAFGMAAVLEGAIVAVAVILLAGSLENKPAISDPVPITLADDPPPEQPAESKPMPPPPTPQPKQKTLVKPVESKPQMPPEPTAPPVAQAPSPIAATPNAFTEPAPAPPPPVPSSTGRPDIQASYDAKVRGAVSAWHNANYPVAATTMHYAGKTQVEFHLRDGVVGGVRVLTSCGVGLFDQASLHAVQGASYPETPAELRGHDNLYQIWVEYRN